MKWWSLLALLGCCTACIGSASAGCSADYDRLQRAIDRGDLATGDRLLRRVKAGTECGRQDIDKVGYRFQQKVLQRADDEAQAGNLAAAEAILDGYGPKSYVAPIIRGDIASQRRDWAQAAKVYALGYEMAAQPGSGADAAEQMQLYRLAQESLMLAGDLELVLRRGGKPAGIFSSRGPKPRARAVPIQFPKDRDEFSPLGQANAERLASYLAGIKGLRSVTLIGHTDPDGTDAYNLALSKRRAGTLRQFLRDNGVAVPIRVEGRGKEQPPLISNKDRYNKKELYALYRRVEFEVDVEQ